MSAISVLITLLITLLINTPPARCQQQLPQPLKTKETINQTSIATLTINECLIDTRVSMLRCAFVSIDHIQEALDQWDLKGIKRLSILYGAFKKIDRLTLSSTSKILQMSEISISNCGLEELNEQALDGFDYNELESIDLSWNALTQMPRIVLRLGRLRHLDLSHNQIFKLPPGSSFNSLNALATLKLSGNK